MAELGGWESPFHSLVQLPPLNTFTLRWYGRLRSFRGILTRMGHRFPRKRAENKSFTSTKVDVRWTKWGNWHIFLAGVLHCGRVGGPSVRVREPPEQRHAPVHLRHAGPVLLSVPGERSLLQSRGLRQQNTHQVPSGLCFWKGISKSDTCNANQTQHWPIPITANCLPPSNLGLCLLFSHTDYLHVLCRHVHKSPLCLPVPTSASFIPCFQCPFKTSKVHFLLPLMYSEASGCMSALLQGCRCCVWRNALLYRLVVSSGYWSTLLWSPSCPLTNTKNQAAFKVTKVPILPYSDTRFELHWVVLTASACLSARI